MSKKSKDKKPKIEMPMDEAIERGIFTQASLAKAMTTKTKTMSQPAISQREKRGGENMLEMTVKVDEYVKLTIETVVFKK